MHKYSPARSLVQKAHRDSQKVVFTHGVFDLFHKGHLRTLNESKSLGDILIVGLDSDKLVKKLKGESRPIINENDRLEVISNIKAVDFAFIIIPDEKEMEDLDQTFKDLYRYLDVDILTSGISNQYRRINEKICKELGIEYFSIAPELVETTTWIVERVRGDA